MKIIHRHILREFLRILFLTLISFVAVFLIVDFFEKIDNFTEAGVSLTRVGYYYALFVPQIVFLMAPVAVLVAVLISLGLLARNSEIVACKAGGLSVFNLSRPIFVASIALSVLMFLLADTVIPRTSAVINSIWNLEVEQDDDATSLVRENIWLKSQGRIYHFGRYDGETKLLTDISINFFDQSFHMVERIEAERARPADGQWELENGLVKTNETGGDIVVERFEKKLVQLPEIPTGYSRAELSSDEMSFLELSEFISRMKQEGYDPLRFRVDLQLKLSFPFICAIMAIIGLPIAFWKEKGGGIALGIGVGIGLSFCYLVLLGLARSLGYSGLIPPAVAAWFPNVTFAILGLFLFTNVRQ